MDYLHSHDRKPGKDVLICAFGGGAELRALQKKGEVAVIGALDDIQLAELTAHYYERGYDRDGHYTL